MPQQPLLHFKEIKKSFSGNVVLNGVDFSIMPGEVVALAGENGAGKSTLMNILFGMEVIRATGGYEGQIELEGNVVDVQSPADAMAKGIGMVHQEFMLIPGFTVARNIKLNRENVRPSLLSRVGFKSLQVLDEKAIRRDAQSSLDRLGMEIRPDEIIARLPVGYKQFVEIAREISKDNLRLLVLDEPTAVLTESEAEKFLQCIRQIADSGVSVIFISHRLDEVMQLADRVVILRDGQLVFDDKTSNTSKKQIAELMVGRALNTESIVNGNREFPEGDYVLEIEHLKVDMPGEQTKDVNLNVRRGEILGIGGLAGHGKTGIANGLFAMYPATGSVKYNGQPFPYDQVGAALNANMAFVSEDRKGVGLLLDQSIRENIVYTDMRVRRHFLKKYPGFCQFDRAAADKAAKEMIQEFDIRCTGTEQPVGRLSGGNQQKVCIARAVLLNPDVLFVSEPTRGIDIGAKQIVLDYLVKLNRERGITVIVTSSELNELRTVCDRIAIVTNGVVQGILPPDAPNVDFAMLMSGEELQEGEEA